MKQQPRNISNTNIPFAFYLLLAMGSLFLPAAEAMAHTSRLPTDGPLVCAGHLLINAVDKDGFKAGRELSMALVDHSMTNTIMSCIYEVETNGFLEMAWGQSRPGDPLPTSCPNNIETEITRPRLDSIYHTGKVSLQPIGPPSQGNNGGAICKYSLRKIASHRVSSWVHKPMDQTCQMIPASGPNRGFRCQEVQTRPEATITCPTLDMNQALTASANGWVARNSENIRGRAMDITDQDRQQKKVGCKYSIDGGGYRDPVLGYLYKAWPNNTTCLKENGVFNCYNDDRAL